MKKERLDTLLVARGLASGRERAKRLIMAGQVLVDERRIDKAGTTVDADAHLRVVGEDLPYVSRGGLKLAKGMSTFGIVLMGKAAADIGASTGGFTDCMLQNGAARVYAIDVGYGQLDWKLRTDARVVNMERTNIRNVTPDMFETLLDFASIDVAFISLDKVLPAVRTLLYDGGEVVALIKPHFVALYVRLCLLLVLSVLDFVDVVFLCFIKPQFEAGKGRVGKNGVVRDPHVHEEVILSVLSAAEQVSFTPAGLTFSPVKGPKGNIEYLLYLRTVGEANTIDAALVHDIVTQAHAALDR